MAGKGKKRHLEALKYDTYMIQRKDPFLNLCPNLPSRVYAAPYQDIRPTPESKIIALHIMS